MAIFRFLFSLQLFAFILMELCVGLSPSFAQTTFQRTYGGTANEWAYSVQQTSDGGYIIAGRHSPGAGAYVYLVKTNSSGDTLWTRTYAGRDIDVGYSVQQTSDGGYIIVGYTTSFGACAYDVYLVKTNSSGDTLWTRTYGGTCDDVGYSVQQTSDGGYIIAGYTTSFGAGAHDVYLVKTNSSGDTLWTRSYGGTGLEVGLSVRQTTDSGCIIVGYTNSFGAGAYDVYLVKTNSSGDTLWTRTYAGTDIDGGSSVQQASDGGYIIAGYTSSFGAGGLDVYLVKTNPSGDTLWTKTYGGIGDDVGYSVQQTSDGRYIIAGYTNSLGAGGLALYLVKTSSSGDTLWTRTYGGTGDDVGYSVQQTSDGGYIIAGHTYSFGAGGPDVYLVKTQADGLVSVQDDRNIMPTTFALLQNYPNPFNPSTTIDYSVPERASVEIRVLDVLGREVATLLNEEKPAGAYTVRWDADAVASGVYFYRLQTGGFVQTRKMVLLR